MRLLAITASVISLLGATLPSANAAYDQHPRFAEFAKQLEQEYKIPASEAKSWLAQAKKQQSVLDAIQRPAEKSKEWHEYRKIFLTDKRISGGKAFLKKHADLLQQAEDKYGVKKEVIAAIIGVETYYGKRQGRYRVLDSLSTLAFDYPKRPLFWRELKAFFSLAEKENLDPGKIKGSYAGAMGYGQFIPTSYLSYAVDGDKDGKRDLWGNPADAIASVANYFKRHGWRKDEPVVQRVRVSGEHYQDVVNDRRKPKWTAGELKALGVKPTESIADDKPATLIKLQGEKGAEFWLGEYNFYVITRYNHSRMYAMAVHQLSEELAK